jgi:hypothetical protein
MSTVSATMTSRERMLAALRRQPHDRVPISPYIQQGSAWDPPLRWFNQIDRARKMKQLDLDPTIDVWLPDVRPPNDVTFTSKREKRGSQTFITKEYHTPAGSLRTVVEETRDWCEWEHGGWIPTTFGNERNRTFAIHLFDDWCVSRRSEPWVKGRGDLDALRHLIRMPTDGERDEWLQDGQRAVEFARENDLLVCVRRAIVGDAFEWFCDITWFLMQLIDDPDFVDEFLTIFQDWAMDQLRAVLELDVDVVQYRGWYEIPTLWGREFWQQHLQPRIAEQAKLVHDAGKIFSLLLPEGHGVYADLLGAMDIDVLQGVDPRMLHAGDLHSLFEHCGDSKSFWGGVDTEVTVESCNPQCIDDAVREAIEALNGNHGLILSAFLWPETAQPGVLHFFDACHKHGNLEAAV